MFLRTVARVLWLCGACLALAGAAAAQSALQAPQGLTAFRPQHGGGYAPFERTKVPEALEEDLDLGPGIRRNGPGEVDPAGEDDLVELVVGRALRGNALVLERGASELALWTTRDKQPGSALLFSANRSAPLVFGGPSLTLWAEWTGAVGERVALQLRALEADAVLDRLIFHAFESHVVALGGESQVPSIPPDPNHGTFLVAIELYERGWDVHMYDEVVNAIQKRGVGEVASFGYSHGGGSTHDLCERMDAFRATIGTFAIPFTSYVDGVQNDSDVDVDMELRKPPSSAYHANHYQRGTFGDFFLDGGPVPVSEPPPTGLDVETIFWGAGATHFVVDDFSQVRDFILLNLELRMSR